MTTNKNDSNADEVSVIGAQADNFTVKQALVKALVITGRADDEQAAFRAINEQDDEWQNVGAVDPILDPEALMGLYEISDILRQNIDAYATNIEMNGHVLKPKIDLEKDDAASQIRNAMDAAKWADAVEAAMADLDARAAENNEVVTDEQRQDVIQALVVQEPTDSEVRAKTEELRIQMRREMHQATAWFRNVNPEMSFIDLRERKRIDEETIGHACWEVIRDKNGKLRRLEPMAGYTVLPTKEKGEEFEVRCEEWVSEIETRPVVEPVKFRRYIQRIDGKTIYYKDLNDPRLISANTGKVYMKKVGANDVAALQPDLAKMKRDEPDAKPATELIYFAIYSPKTTAGMVRWAGHLTAVIGSRAAAEANLAYFENHAVPDAALLISGGQLNNESVQRIQEMLRSKVKGPGNHHRTLVVQATAKSTQPNQVTNNPDMEWVNLSDFQQGDSLFQGYTENNKTSVSSAFRQALLLLGHIPSDLNRATAYAILSLIEKQVYGPLRNKFDWWVNNILLPTIGIKLIRFESLSPEATNIEEMSKSIEQGVKGGAFTPNHLLEMYGDWLNRAFHPIEASWGDVPFAATLAQINLDAEPPVEEPEIEEGPGGAESEIIEDPEAGDDKSKRSLMNRLNALEGQVAKLNADKTREAVIMAGFGHGGRE